MVSSSFFFENRDKFLFLQMQGVVYFDFFLFTPSENTSCKSELATFDNLINYGKARFLIHPVLEGKQQGAKVDLNKKSIPKEINVYD